MVQKETNKVKFSGNRDKNKFKKKSKVVPLVITFHPLLKDAGNIIHKNLYLLYMDQETQRVFMPGSMITSRSARKLSSFLVRAKLYPLERTVGSLSVMVNDVKFVTMKFVTVKHRLSLAPYSKYLQNKSSV